MDKDLVDINLKFISTVANKESKHKDHDFIKQVVFSIDSRFDQHKLTEAILEDGTVLAAFFISHTSHLFEINELKLIKQVGSRCIRELMLEDIGIST